jgi:hypothetical protein
MRALLAGHAVKRVDDRGVTHSRLLSILCHCRGQRSSDHFSLTGSDAEISLNCDNVENAASSPNCRLNGTGAHAMLAPRRQLHRPRFFISRQLSRRRQHGK